ncbi:MAG TPA: gamma-glutamyltransferase [Lacipirellulaceae bacterium]|nr:gamma-glutamyltransferase [Lacipirellulaceae bacterium]
MKRVLPSRREFLRQSSAALTVGCTLGAFGRRAVASTQASRDETNISHQAVACSRREAASAARDILRQGGNAIDAAVAALVVQCVIEPKNVGIGGYGGSLVLFQAKTGRVHALDFDSRAPRNFDPATFNQSSARHGCLATGVPGIVAGIDLALREYGSLPFKTIAKSAVALAENGIVVTSELANTFKRLATQMDEISRRAHFPNGVPSEGATWVQTDLARLIRRLGDEGLASFYKGDIAATIARQVQQGGGTLAEEDFHDFRASFVEPLHIAYRGHELYTPPLPSGGLTSLSILKTLEQFDVAQLAPWGAEYVELFAGAANLGWGERYQYFGDPEFVNVPVDELLSDERARARAKILRERFPTVSSTEAKPSSTINIVVKDAGENLVSLTATHGEAFGSRVAIDGLGLILGHGMSRFNTNRSSPNFPAPRKRPQHNMSPLVVLRDGKPYAAFGLVGGPKIVTVTAQLAVNLIDFRADPQHVVSSPRIHTEGEEPIQVTADTHADAVNDLRMRGRRVRTVASIGGPANTIVIDPKMQHVQPAASNGPSGVLVF